MRRQWWQYVTKVAVMGWWWTSRCWYGAPPIFTHHLWKPCCVTLHCDTLPLDVLTHWIVLWHICTLPPTARYKKVSQLSTRYCQALATSWVGIEGQLIFIRPDDWCSECSEYKCENRRTSVEMQKFDDYCNDLDESVKITNIDELHSSSFPILWG